MAGKQTFTQSDRLNADLRDVSPEKQPSYLNGIGRRKGQPSQMKTMPVDQSPERPSPAIVELPAHTT